MKSLRVRLIAAVMAVALVALLAADLATYSELRSFLDGRVDQTLDQAAGPIGGAVRSGVFLGSPFAAGNGNPSGGGASTPVTLPAGAAPAPVTSSRSEFTATTPGTYFGVVSGRDSNRYAGLVFAMISASGKVTHLGSGYYASNGHTYRPALPSHITGFHKETAPNGGGPSRTVAYFTVSSTPSGGPAFRVLAIEEPHGQIVTLATSMSETQSTLQRLVLIELFVTLAALVFAALIGLWLVRIGLRPLDEVETTAERVAAGELDQRVPGEDARTEVGRLAGTINTMLTRIEQAFAQRDATEAELRRSEERLRQFVADASHELRTPLAAVSAYAELFDRGASSRPDDLGRVFSGIRSETDRMGHLVDDLLLLARLDEGRPLAHEPVELLDVATEAVDAARAVGPAWPVTLQASGPVTVIGDAARLRQVLDNLLSNSRAHTPEGTSVVLEIGTEGNDAVIEVRDDGPGFGDQNTERVFERFFRADPARSRSSGGTGLGLSIVGAIVTAHHGTVAAADVPSGGASITLRLPLVSDRGGVRTDGAAPAGPQPAGRPDGAAERSGNGDAAPRRSAATATVAGPPDGPARR
jgi:two-component system OmpR family sensor kinase